MTKFDAKNAAQNLRLRKILHAEDDDVIRDIVRMSLGTIGGFKLLQFSSGEAVLEAAHGFDPDLILMDVMMPGIGGMEAARRLRNSCTFRHTPLIFVTARATRDEVQYLRSDFFAEVITKPFDPIALPAEINTLWQQFVAEKVRS